MKKKTVILLIAALVVLLAIAAFAAYGAYLGSLGFVSEVAASEELITLVEVESISPEWVQEMEELARLVTSQNK
jgi:ABC-type sugar transport system substrate-binding protein